MLINRRIIDATLRDLKGRALEQLGKFLHEPEVEDAGKAARTRSRIQRAAADESRDRKRK